jgi:hypothetical protein
LHWGEEIEYHLYHLDHATKTVKLACDASDILAKYKNLSDEDQKQIGFKLLPEFGNWMIEAVPSAPYDTYSNPNQLLSSLKKISER